MSHLEDRVSGMENKIDGFKHQDIYQDKIRMNKNNIWNSEDTIKIQNLGITGMNKEKNIRVEA